MSIKIDVDVTIGAAYITLSDEEVARTVEFSEQIMIDVDQFGVAIGIEVLDQSTPLPFTALCEQFHVHSDVIDLLRLIRPDVESFLTMTTGNDGMANTNRSSFARAAG